jgi:hypothetical protein
LTIRKKYIKIVASFTQTWNEILNARAAEADEILSMPEAEVEPLKISTDQEEQAVRAARAHLLEGEIAQEQRLNQNRELQFRVQQQHSENLAQRVRLDMKRASLGCREKAIDSELEFFLQGAEYERAKRMSEFRAIEIESTDACDLWGEFSELERARLSERKARIDEKRALLRELQQSTEDVELTVYHQNSQKFEGMRKKLDEFNRASRTLAILQDEQSRLRFECIHMSEQETEYHRLIRDQARKDEEWESTKNRIQKKSVDVGLGQNRIIKRSQELKQRRERLERNKARAASYTERVTHFREKLEQKRILLRNMENRVERELKQPQSPQTQSLSNSGLSKSLDLNENSSSNSLITTSPNAR